MKYNQDKFIKYATDNYKDDRSKFYNNKLIKKFSDNKKVSGFCLPISLSWAFLRLCEEEITSDKLSYYALGFLTENMNELAILVEYDNLKKHETPNPAAIRELLGQRISNLMDIALVTDIRVPQPWIQSRNLEVPQVDYFNAIHQNPGMHILSLTARDSSGIIGGHSTAIHIFANNQGVYFDPNVGSVEVRNSATSAQFCHDFFTHALSHLWRKAQGNRSITVEINRTVELT